MAHDGCRKHGTGDAMHQKIQDATQIIANSEPSVKQPEPAADICVLIETNVLDAHNASLLVAQIKSREEMKSCPVWTLDFQRVQFIDSAGASAIADLIRLTHGRNRIDFTGVKSQIRNRWPKLFETPPNFS